MTTMTYGQLVEAYVAVRAERDRLRDELDRLRVQLAEAREQRDQAAEALVRAETERDEALCAITKIAEALGFPGGDLREAIRALRRERDDALQEAESVGRQLHGSTREVDRLIAQLATVTEERDEARAEIARLERAAHEQGAGSWTAEDWANWLRKRIQLAMDMVGYLLAPETAPESPQTDEQAQVRADTHTGAVIDALAAEIDRLRTEAAVLRARVREWEAVHADLAARCDSGDIPIRLGERYSQAVLREIDRLRTERDRLRTPRIEDGATVHIDDGRYTVVDVDFRGETAVVTLRPTTTGDSDA